MKSAPFARLVSLLCLSFGALMLVAPDQFGAPQYVVLRTHIVVWGAVFLATGLALLAATVLDVRGWRRSSLLAGGGVVLIAVGGAFGLAGAWMALAVPSTLGLATLLVAATPGRRAGTGGRRELLEIVIGASTVMLGVSVLLTDAASVGILGDKGRWYGLVLALGGGLLLLGEVGGLTSSWLARAGRLSTATGLMVYVGLNSFPERAWTDALLYAGFSLALAMQPPIDPRFNHIDAASLRIRLALVLCAAATLPLVALFVIAVDWPASLALAEVRGGREVVFGLLLACAALAVAAGVLMAGQLDEPLQMLAAAAARFGDGDVTVRLPRSRITEVALLASNFATMRHALATRTADLEQAEFDARRAEAGLRELNQRLEQRVTERTTELERVSKRKSAFLTSMSHELRTPLNAIIGFSEIMLDHDVVEIPDEQRKTYLEHIQHSGHHLLGLVNDILDLAKVESGHMELSLERVPLQSALVGCVDVIRSMSDPKLLTLVTHCEPADALVTADPARLKQIVYNLLSNAVKFTPTGGQISVSAQVDAIEALIAIRDSGIGIRPEDEELIFEPFRQAKASLVPKQEGTGLGLPLVRELVGLHGGRVWLDSAPGVGSCFTFTLPHGLNRLKAGPEARAPEVLAITR